MKYKKINSELDLLLPEGEYEGKVVYSQDKLSYTGEEVMLVKINVLVSTFLYNLFDELSGLKLKRFCMSAGIEDLYNREELHPEEVIGKVIHFRSGIRLAKGKYPAKNFVIDYVPKTEFPDNQLDAMAMITKELKEEKSSMDTFFDDKLAF